MRKELLKRLIVVCLTLTVICLTASCLGEPAGHLRSILLDDPVYYVDSMDSVISSIWSAAGRRVTRVTMYSFSSVDFRKNSDELQQIIYSSGVAEFKWSLNTGKLQLYDIVYPEHFGQCKTTNEVVSYIHACADQGITDFVVCMLPALGRELYADDKATLNETLARTRLKNPLRYGTYKYGYKISFKNAEFADTDQDITSLSEFLMVFGEHADRLESEFDIRVSDELYDQLYGKSTIGAGDNTLIADIKENNGIYHNSHLHLGHNLLFSDVKYYDGKIILNAYRNGQTSTLNKRQFETLSSALALVKGVTGTELERELAIHDALCARITYQADDDPHNDDDCVIGALLYGKANCDGYADAFYLCGGLAGLDIRYQHGTAVDRSKDSETFIEKDETHLWNLIRIGERWAMIDVTWDDDEYGYAHTYYNIGMEQAKATHIWDERAMRYALTETTDNDLRNPELKQSQVSSFDGNGLGVVLLGYVQNRSERICLSSKSLSFITHEDELSILLYSDGITDFKWKLTPVAAEIYDIKYVEEFKCIIDKNDIFPYIEYLANSNIRSFSLYIHPYNPALREYLFSNNCAMLCYALARTRLVNPEGFRYNEKYGRVVFTNAEFYPSTVEWKTLAPPTVYRMQQDIWEFAAERGQYLIIDFSRTLGLNSNHDLIETALYSAGIDHFSGGFYGPSLRITNIQYPKHFTQVYSTTYPLGEIKSYIESCSKLGIHHFIVCFPREEYRKAFGNVQSELTRLFAEAGVANPSNARWWSAYCKVVFDNAEFYPASVKWEYKKVFSMDYVQWAVEDFVNERGDILILDYSSGPDLYENYKQLSSILYSSGIKTFDCEFYCGMVRIKNVQYK